MIRTRHTIRLREDLDLVVGFSICFGPPFAVLLLTRGKTILTDVALPMAQLTTLIEALTDVRDELARYEES